MAPTLLGRKTENCRTSGPPIFEVVSGKSICILFEPRAKIGEGKYLTVYLPFPTEFAFRKGVGLHLGGRGAKAALTLEILALQSASAVHSIDSV